jgi:hypothetical protein
MLTMTDEQLIAYYIDLLEVQYHDKPNAAAEMTVWVREALANQVVQKVIDGFNLNLNVSDTSFDMYPIDNQGTYVEWGNAALTAEGNQLDIIAKYIGISRVINGLDLSKRYFQSVPYDDIAPDDYMGHAYYEDAVPPSHYYMSYRDVINSLSVSDTDFRQLILLKIQLNKFDGTLLDADRICQMFFGAAVRLIDNKDMTITYHFNSSLVTDFIRVVVYMRMLPRPSGVQMIIVGGGPNG